MYNYIKRTGDLFLALIILILGFPIILFFIIILFFNFRGRPFFMQKRIGFQNKEFSIIKLKTMTDLQDDKGNPLPDKDRITKLGSFIRKLSLDEIPQIINVLNGQMSFVGPRPLSPKLLPYYTDKEMLRHEVKPGITGWAQVNGRNSLNWDLRLAYDVEYYEKQSFFLDFKIIITTIANVLTSKDVSTIPQIPSLIKTRDPNKKTVNDN